MKKETSYSTFSLIKDLWAFIRPYKGRFIFVSLMRVFAETLWLYPTFALASIATFFTHYHVGESLEPFFQIMYAFTASSALYFIALYASSLIGNRMAEKAAVDSQFAAVRHILTLDIDWHERENTGNKAKRIDRGSSAINQLVRMWLGSFIPIAVSLFGIVAIISRFDRTIALSTCAFLVFYFFVSVFFTKKAVAIHKVENVKEEELSGLIFESINNVRSAKVMSMVAPLSKMLKDMSVSLYDLIHLRVFWYQSGGSSKNICGQAFRIVVMFYIGWGIMQGRYEIGFMLLFYGYFSNIQAAVSQLAEVSQDFAVRKQAIGRMTDLLRVQPVTDVEDGKIAFPKDWKKIELRNVSFSYGDKKVLDDITFTISRHEKIGVVGLSGSGKSTLFKLLLKERETYEGDILVDGVPLRSISKVDYFSHAAVVLQETEVFNFSLRENIAISNSERASDAGLLEKALTVAHVSEFAKGLPQGIDTQIGEKGIKLSGGERQRVGLARAVFKDPELLLLDEATSHLDVESEEKIQDSLHQFFQTVTAIVVAHRLTTIKEMDKILVIEGGRILEQGSFADLYGRKGRFYELWEKQKL